MTVPINVSDMIQLRVWTTAAEQAAVNSFNYLVTAVTGTGVTDQVVADYVQGVLAADTNWLSMLANAVLFNGVEFVFLNRRPLPQPALSTGGPTSGTGGAAEAPRQSTGLTTWHTAFAGPGFRGRTYWPFPPAADSSTGGLPGNAYIAAAIAVSALLSVFNPTSGGSTAVLRLQLYKRAPLPTPANMTPITSALVRSKWATQKRRGSYGRANTSPFA